MVYINKIKTITTHSQFYARSQNCQKRLEPSSRPSVYTYGITRLPLDRLHFFLLNSCRLWNRVEKQGRATDDDVAQKRHTSYFSNATVVTRTHLLRYMYTAYPAEPDSQGNFRFFTYRTLYASEDVSTRMRPDSSMQTTFWGNLLPLPSRLQY